MILMGMIGVFVLSGGAGQQTTTEKGAAFGAAGGVLGMFGESVAIEDLTFPIIAAIDQAYRKDEDITSFPHPHCSPPTIRRPA